MADDTKAVLRQAAQQQQFLDVVDRDEAEMRFRRHIAMVPLGEEAVPLAGALGRVLARDIVAAVDVPGFDRAGVDGFAVRASDTTGASDEAPCELRLNAELLTPGVAPQQGVAETTATVIATGGMVPRGADAVVMVEHTETREDEGGLVVEIRRPVVAGQFIQAAGFDIARGETVLRKGQALSSREIGALAAIGLAEVFVWRKPRVAIFSTGDELLAPGDPIRPGAVYDSNASILAASVEELGGVPIGLGIARDDEAELAARLEASLAYDLVLLSGGTSKGAGDLAFKVVSRLDDPGIVVHGAALKPGKPICLAVTRGKPVVVLPGFPTSAIFTFHEFVAPVIRAFAGRPPERRESVSATLPVRVASERGRTEYVLASLVEGQDGSLAAYPTIKGSGAVTAFGQADGFFKVPPQTESVAAGIKVDVTLIGAGHKLADLVTIGSHCVGLDMLVGHLMADGLAVKALAVGSMGGLAAAKRGECDIAGIHLMDLATGEYNRAFVNETLELFPGYGRMQGIVFRRGDARFDGRTIEACTAAALADPACLMINRNAGSGTRILIDRLLNGLRPPGYAHQAKSHNAVAVAVAQKRADWGVAIETVARQYGLGFLPLQAERYDFVVPKARIERVPVQRFLDLLHQDAIRVRLAELGFEP
ncbi:MAG TPA: molybdopterin biosynthesis protein [Lichenihabitans sp.]|nr:molybdopterin biosynthesis protein [Lichenihabitans sp.]